MLRHVYLSTIQTFFIFLSIEVYGRESVRFNFINYEIPTLSDPILGARHEDILHGSDHGLQGLRWYRSQWRLVGQAGRGQEPAGEHSSAGSTYDSNVSSRAHQGVPSLLPACPQHLYPRQHQFAAATRTHDNPGKAVQLRRQCRLHGSCRRGQTGSL